MQLHTQRPSIQQAINISKYQSNLKKKSPYSPITSIRQLNGELSKRTLILSRRNLRLYRLDLLDLPVDLMRVDDLQDLRPGPSDNPRYFMRSFQAIQQNFISVFSKESNRDGSGVFLKYPVNTTSKDKVSAEQIASNFSCELIAVRTALDIYLTRTNIDNSDGIIVLSDCKSALEVIKEGKMGLTQEINSFLFSIGALGKSCTLQCIPAHLDIEGNEMADSFANEARTIEPVTSSTTVFDANAVANQNARKKLSLPELNYSREITTTIIRLRTKHFKGMKILPDGSRSYGECEHCPCTQLDPKHLFSCPTIVGALFKIVNDCSMPRMCHGSDSRLWQYFTVSLRFIITTSAHCHIQQQQ
ncbi:RNase H domain-containing protein [Trichonephila clavipes]|nr:RNase H domain-containing protein [Trichonephila clavipes]